MHQQLMERQQARKAIEAMAARMVKCVSLSERKLREHHAIWNEMAKQANQSCLDLDRSAAD